MSNVIPLVDTMCWPDESSEKYCCEIATSILAHQRNELYCGFIKEDMQNRTDTACDLSFKLAQTKYFLEHTAVSAYKKQHEDQGRMAKSYESNSSIPKTKAKIIERFAGGPGALVSLDDDSLKQGIQYRSEIYSRKIEKLMKYDGVRIIVIQTVDISATGDPFSFYSEIVPISKDVDYICYVASGHKDYKYWVTGGVPVYFWQKSINKEFNMYTYHQTSYEIEYVEKYPFVLEKWVNR